MISQATKTASSSTAPPPSRVTRALTDRQRLLLSVMAQYWIATGEPCSMRYLARRLHLSKSTVHEHIRALHKKGYLAAPCVPSGRVRTPK